MLGIVINLFKSLDKKNQISDIMLEFSNFL